MTAVISKSVQMSVKHSVYSRCMESVVWECEGFLMVHGSSWHLRVSCIEPAGSVLDLIHSKPWIRGAHLTNLMLFLKSGCTHEQNMMYVDAVLLFKGF